MTDQAARSITVSIYDTTLFLKLDHKKRLEERSGYYYEAEPPGPQTPLHLALRRSWQASANDLMWTDGADAKVETMIGPIVAEFFVEAEASYRRFRNWEHSHRIERKASRIEEIRLAAEEAERKRLEGEEQLRLERISALMNFAESYRKAETIRALVASIEHRRSADADFPQWKDWALRVAADLDPIDAIAFCP